MDRKTALEKLQRPIIINPRNFPGRDLAVMEKVVHEHHEAAGFLAGYVAQLEASIDRLTEERDLAQHRRDDVPRTITLTYMPAQPEPEQWDADLHWDSGNHWTISEGGKHQDRLDSREALAMIAAMLLGAKHPPLRTITDAENAGASRQRRRMQPMDCEAVKAPDPRPESPSHA